MGGEGVGVWAAVPWMVRAVVPEMAAASRVRRAWVLRLFRMGLGGLGVWWNNFSLATCGGLFGGGADEDAGDEVVFDVEHEAAVGGADDDVFGVAFVVFARFLGVGVGGFGFGAGAAEADVA